MRSRRPLVLAIFFTVLAVACYAGGGLDKERLFLSGNELYEQGEYADAIEAYSGIVRSGKASAAVYYNLAGAYFKYGDLGRAVLNYERALNMAPRDPEIRANHRFAGSMVTGRPPAEKGIWAWGPLALYVNNFTADEMAVMASAAFFLMFVLLAVSVLFPRARAYSAVLAGMLALFILLSSVVIRHKINVMDSYAVIIASQSDAMFGPFDTATRFFTLYEGSGVMIIGERNGWYRVRRPDGKTGWVKKNDAERI